MTVTEPGVGQTALLDDEALIRRIFDHIDNDTTDLGDATWREPVDNYRRPERLRDEIDSVLRRHPAPFCPVAALPDAGSYVAREAAGVPIIAVRGHDGVVRAFRNSCRHRGTALASGDGCAGSLVCPYHGWVYRLDGSLRHVPDEYGFPGLDRESRGLVPVDTMVHGGIVFVSQDGSAGEELISQVPALVGDDQELIGCDELVLDANWKVLLEGFLEGYHIKATHRTTFFPFGYDNLNVVETYGRNSRVVFPFRRVAELREQPPESWRLDRVVTIVHQLFPNTIIARLSHHTTMVVLEPLAVDRTKFVTYSLTNRGSGEAARADARRDTEFVNQGLAEDRAMAYAVQRGLASGANEFVEFGRFESAIVHFHRELTRLLADAATVSAAD